MTPIHEIQIGDWFRHSYKAYGEKVVLTFRVTQIEKALGRYYVWGEDLYGESLGRTCKPEQLEPIELTDEILHNNGFVDDGDRIILKDEYDRPELILRRGYYNPKQYSIDISETIQNVRYVHDLQRVMNFLQIEDREIVLKEESK